jgi:hypothetical protein
MLARSYLERKKEENIRLGLVKKNYKQKRNCGQKFDLEVEIILHIKKQEGELEPFGETYCWSNCLFVCLVYSESSRLIGGWWGKRRSL